MIKNDSRYGSEGKRRPRQQGLTTHSPSFLGILRQFEDYDHDDNNNAVFDIRS